MSVRVYPDNGPSYDLHEPKPSTGPAVCSHCKHVRKDFLVEPQFCKSWTCDAVPGRLVRQAGIDSITGEAVPEIIDRPRCVDRNARGECADFVAGQPAAAATDEAKRATPSRDNKVSLAAFVVGIWVGVVAAAVGML